MAREGARIVVAAKTTAPHPRLPGTIYTAAREIEAAGGEALPVPLDVRFEDQIDAAVTTAVAAFGGLDILIHNAGAVRLTGTAATPLARFDLLHAVNVRGPFALTRACLPHLRQAPNPHVLALAPPIDLDPCWLAPHLPYTLSKYGLSLCVMGWAAELASDAVAVNGLWPRSIIATAALTELGGAVRPEECRRPEIVAEAAARILTRPSRSCTGNFFLDEEVLTAEGVTDLTAYAVEPGHPLRPDLFVRPDGRKGPDR